MAWYKCKDEACNTAFDIQAILTTHHWVEEKKGSWISCIACGGEAPYVQMGQAGDEAWWLTMEARYGFSRELLRSLLHEFNKQRTHTRFDFWLEWFLKQAEKEEELGA